MDKKQIYALLRQEKEKTKSSLTSQELFCSREYAEHVNNIVRSVTGTYKARGKTPIRIELYWDENCNDTAQTDGTHIRQNTANNLVRYFISLKSQYMAQMGMTLHECAHIMFCNFSEKKKALLAIQNGQFPTSEPIPKTPDEEKTLVEMKSAMQDPNVCEVLAYALHKLQNIADDAHDEDCLIDESGSFVSDAINTTRYALWGRCMKSPLERTMKAVEEGRISKLEMIFDCMLQFIRFHDVAVEDDFAASGYEPIVLMKQIAPFTSSLRYTDKPETRNKLLNEILFRLWPCIQDCMDDLKAEMEQQGRGVDPSEVAKAVIDILKSAAENCGASSSDVTNGKTSNLAKASAAGSEDDGSDPNGQSGAGLKGSDTDEDTGSFTVLINQLTQNAAEDAVQAMIRAETNVTIVSTPASSAHAGISINNVKIGGITKQDVTRYDRIMEDLLPYSRKTQREVARLLEQMKNGSISHHRIYGKCLEASEAYRPDQRYYAKKNLPQDIPEMAISILVDHSGSMSGERIQASMQASMLLYDFATSLGIPTAVAGHNVCNNGAIEYYSYTDFDKITENEKYRLAKMSVSGCNRDGLALEIAYHLLDQRPEQIKLLFIISDGQPNDNDYGGDPAFRDMKQIVGKYRKRDIQTIAAAIGSDKERIKEIYGDDSFIDISSLDLLPKTLTGILRKKILI